MLTLTKVSPSVWHAVRGEGTVAAAAFMMDGLGQVFEVSFATDNPDDRLQCKQLALSHAARFMRQRSVSATTMLFLETLGEVFSDEEDSDRAMSFDMIPIVVRMMDDEEVSRVLAMVGVNVADVPLKGRK